MTSNVYQGVTQESATSAVHWGAIFAGVTTSAAIGLALLALGSGIDLMSVSPWHHEGVSAGTFGILAVAWLIAVQLLSSGVGGYICGRLRIRWNGTHTDEVYFRDTAHGLIVWAVGTLLSAFLLSSVLSSIGSSAAKVGGSVASGIGGMAASATGGAASSATASASDSQSSGSSSYVTDTLFRSDKAPAGDTASAKAEVAKIFAASVVAGKMSPEDDGYASQVIARSTGLAPAAAQQRLHQALATAIDAKNKAIVTAQATADAARKAAVYFALWTFASMLIGAFSSCYFAVIGGRLRDDLPAIA